MDTFIKIFNESGAGGEQRLEDSINKFAIKRKLDIVSAKPCFRKGVLEDTMFVVVVFKRKATIADIKEVVDAANMIFGELIESLKEGGTSR